MAAMDQRECSHYALKWSLENLRDRIQTSPPFILFAVKPIKTVNYISASTYGASYMELKKSALEDRKKMAMALLERAKEVAAVTVTEFGDPRELICETVEKSNVDVLILGSDGRSALQRAFLGSLSKYRVQNAKCPVLVVKKPL